jgi:hypothetical protein
VGTAHDQGAMRLQRSHSPSAVYGLNQPG